MITLYNKFKKGQCISCLRYIQYDIKLSLVNLSEHIGALGEGVFLVQRLIGDFNGKKR
jgi:hypothetical protein